VAVGEGGGGGRRVWGVGCGGVAVVVVVLCVCESVCGAMWLGIISQQWRGRFFCATNNFVTNTGAKRCDNRCRVNIDQVFP